MPTTSPLPIFPRVCSYTAGEGPTAERACQVHVGQRPWGCACRPSRGPAVPALFTGGVLLCRRAFVGYGEEDQRPH